MTAPNSIKARLDEAKWIMKRQMDRIAALEAENERLKANASAHQTLASIYTDPNQPTGHRIRAATAALACETPRLESVPPAIDSTCEVIEPLADVVRRQRARADRMMLEPPFSDLPKHFPLQSNSNGSDDSGGN
jgi:hypothetical protein